MYLLQLIIGEVAWYGAWWACFIAIAFLSARHFRWVGILAGAMVISIIIVGLDVHWIFQDMRQHPGNGRDADFVFWLGALCRVVLFNALLSPVSAFGLWLLARQRRIADDTKIA